MLSTALCNLYYTLYTVYQYIIYAQRYIICEQQRQRLIQQVARLSPIFIVGAAGLSYTAYTSAILRIIIQWGSTRIICIRRAVWWAARGGLYSGDCSVHWTVCTGCICVGRSGPASSSASSSAVVVLLQVLDILVVVVVVVEVGPLSLV